ncbi:FAD-binding protein [Streptomyces fumanus]|nr:FAD-binding protein [Streptomyces fumanus]
MAALTAAERGSDVLLLEKAHVRHSGALAMGMDGVNNAVVPGRAEPDDYVAEITRANDGIVDQSTVRQTATRGFAMVRRLESYGVKFEKDEHNEYAVRQVHRSGSYVLPMPEGKDVKKVLYRQLRRREMRERIRIENRVMPVRVLTAGGRAVGAAGFHTRTGRFVTVRAGAVILATGACGRLGLPASGYLYGTYENPTNAGDGYAMAYHAGAELTGIECFQINPLIKDYNGPACAYVANPFGGYQVNRHGERFVDSDYWSGQMMAEFAAEVAGGRPRPRLPEAQPSAGGVDLGPGVDPALHRTPHPGHLPRGPRPRLPHPRRRDAHLRDRPVRRPLRLRGTGGRPRPHHRAPPVRGRGPGLRPAQLHDRRLRLRRPGRRGRVPVLGVRRAAAGRPGARGP